MVLTCASLPHYLLERGLASSSSVVHGDFRVNDISRRNRVFRVVRGTHPGYIVKQVKEWTPADIATLEREARFYSLLREEKLAGLRRFAPHAYAYDAENQVLATELATSVERGKTGLLSPEHARSLGESLREWRQKSHATAEFLQGFPKYSPWVLSFHLQTPHDDEPARAEMLRVIKRESACGRALDALRAQWSTDAFTHGDMKWENCLVSTAGESRVRFIDWELAGWGDPLWDAAGILQDYLANWICWGSSADEVGVAMRAFWQAYQADAGALEKTIGYAAARLLQSASELLLRQARMTAPSVRLLQAALNILNAPEQAVAVFFGAA